MPMGTSPNDCEVGVRVIFAGSDPEPDSVAGDSFTLGPVMFRLAVLSPGVLGLKRTVSMQLAPPARLRPSQPLEEMAKSPASPPSMLAPSGPTRLPPLLVTMKVPVGGMIGVVSPGAGIATSGKS